MARVHDESLRYVLSDYAIAALAEKVPVTEADIYDTILQADLNVDSMNPSSALQSPSCVVWSHFEDFYNLLKDELGEPGDLFELILKKHLGPNGTCTLSLYNYALLSKSNLKVVNRSISKENGFKVAKKVARKASRELFVQKFSCKAPVYHNCRIYANDGRLLCYCDRRKLEWYLTRDLAKLVDEKPPAIMLLFEPKGRPEDEGNDFYIQSKKNICVGCGEGNHYLRYRIIPSCYRMHFPEHLKSHRSHDIVLVCVDCHEKAHAAAEKYKKQIAAEYGIPLFIRKVVDSAHTEDISGSSTSTVNVEDAGVSPLELRTAAMALLRHGPRMPHKRRNELTQIVVKYYGGREISVEDLERALLVGMSPHERRRIEKKRGLSLTSSTRSIISGKELEKNNGSGLPSTSQKTFMSDVPTHAIKEETQTQEDGNIRSTNTNASMPSLCSDFEVCEEAPVTDSNDVKLDTDEVCEAKSDPIFDSEADSNSRNPSNGIVGSVHPSSAGAIPANHNSKLSLLGHGPHGKQVVDYLLKEYGEDGVRQFCQRWRQVFVEAIHPRFLPSGWDVTHRI